ncbi:MAG: PspC domain-containing protein [Candidatus Neomarinimicrobiota bacterium]|nr:MAG: PspC domain-containing protein [Candidatus Neomarinimicrobiota bacterium]
MKKCRYCGHILKEDVSICPNCGRRIYLKRFYKSKYYRKFLGICGGLGEYFGIDSNLIRVIVALIILWTGFLPGIIIYFILGVIIPYSDE